MLRDPITKAGRWLVDRTRWDDGMRGFFVRINATAGPEDMHVHVLRIEDEAVAAERSRIRAGVLGLPIVDVLGGVEWRKAILALLDGGEAKKEGWTEPPMTWQDRLDARKDYLDQYGVASEYDPDLDGGGK